MIDGCKLLYTNIENKTLDYSCPPEIYFYLKQLTEKNITSKDHLAKEKFNKKYKDYRNLVSTILKKGKTNYYNHYFESNGNNAKNT